MKGEDNHHLLKQIDELETEIERLKKESLQREKKAFEAGKLRRVKYVKIYNSQSSNAEAIEGSLLTLIDGEIHRVIVREETFNDYLEMVKETLR